MLHPLRARRLRANQLTPIRASERGSKLPSRSRGRSHENNSQQKIAERKSLAGRRSSLADNAYSAPFFLNGNFRACKRTLSHKDFFVVVKLASNIIVGAGPVCILSSVRSRAGAAHGARLGA
jgi:hypothetical protein